MTDSEKLALIDAMIADFWGCTSGETQEKCAIALVITIGTVLDFKGKE